MAGGGKACNRMGRLEAKVALVTAAAQGRLGEKQGFGGATCCMPGKWRQPSCTWRRTRPHGSPAASW